MLLQQSKSDFKRIMDWKKYQSKVSIERQNLNLDYLIDPSFQGLKRFFVLSFENNDNRKVHAGYYSPKAEIKDYNVKLDSRNFFGQPINDNIKT